jgi:hypothetical protein
MQSLTKRKDLYIMAFEDGYLHSSFLKKEDQSSYVPLKMHTFLVIPVS